MPQSPTLAPLFVPRHRRMSYEQFLEDPSDERAEWVNGEVIPMGTVALAHNTLTAWLLKVLGVLVEDRLGLGTLLHEPFNQKLPRSSGRSPDLMVVLAEHASRIKHNYLDGPADVVIEVLSPGTASVDRIEKYNDYEDGGVAGYWLLDPHREVAEFYRLGSNGKFQPVLVEANGRFDSAVLPGIWLLENWLWQRPPASVVEAAYGLR